MSILKRSSYIDQFTAALLTNEIEKATDLFSAKTFDRMQIREDQLNLLAWRGCASMLRELLKIPKMRLGFLFAAMEEDGMITQAARGDHPDVLNTIWEIPLLKDHTEQNTNALKVALILNRKAVLITLLSAPGVATAALQFSLQRKKMLLTQLKSLPEFSTFTGAEISLSELLTSLKQDQSQPSVSLDAGVSERVPTVTPLASRQLTTPPVATQTTADPTISPVSSRTRSKTRLLS